MADPSDSRPPVYVRDSLTPERIARLRELHEAATPGPWQRAEEFNGTEESWDVNAEGGALEVAFCPEGLDPVERARTATDAELIAEARNALPELLDAAERLRAAGGGLVTAVFYDRDQRSDESAERLRWCLAAMAAELPNPDGAPGTPSPQPGDAPCEACDGEGGGMHDTLGGPVYSSCYECNGEGFMASPDPTEGETP